MGEEDKGKKEERKKRRAGDEGDGIERRLCDAYQLEFSG